MKAGTFILGILSHRVSFVGVCFPRIAKRAANRSRLRMTDPIPTDKSVKIGKLDNGLTYYIKKNPTPENRAYLLLAVDAGSILEDDDQLGIAHFVEHMGFNGTKHFPKHEIIKYLESVGVAFGGCGGGLNAYTGFDQTVYTLTVPTDTAGVVEKAFQILEDWARWANQDDEEIDKERGVILEEWRLHLGARDRYLQKQLPGDLQGLALRGSSTDRQPRGHRDVRPGRSATLLPRLVPPGSLGGRCGGRLRSRKDRETRREALRSHAGRRQPAAAHGV